MTRVRRTAIFVVVGVASIIGGTIYVTRAGAGSAPRPPAPSQPVGSLKSEGAPSGGPFGK